jgi:predicted ArsR family transcriptional regulator
MLSLLGSDHCGAICGRLESGSATQSQLVDELGLQSRDVSATLDQLLLVGLVRWHKGAGEGPGRPAKYWRLVGTGELTKLETFIKEMHRRLIDSG